jgi:ATP-dependent exoDNAse (exonuclease V) beta subunit
VLEHVDLRQQEGVRELCEFLAAEYVDADAEGASHEAATLVERFLRSPRAAELAAANIVRREIEFLLPWPPEGASPSGRFVHGYIDCLYQDPRGRWRLLDYKTNRITADRAPEVAKRYELQMLVYTLACERALGEPLAECTLELLQAGVEYSFTWDAESRRHGVARIHAAIEELAR